MAKEKNVQNKIMILPLPGEIQIEPTVRCNMKCIMCDTKARHRAPDMPLENFKRIVDQLRGVNTLGLHGLGESLLNRGFLDMVKYALLKKFKVRFNTNMSLMTDEVASELMEAGLTEIRFSIDAPNQQIYKQIRGVDLFQSVVERSKIFVRLRGERKTPYIKQVIVLMKENYRHLNEMINLGKEIGVDEVFVQNMQSWSRPEFKEKESKEHSVFGLARGELEKVFSGVRKNDIKVSLPPLEGGKYSCTWPYTGAWISVEGYLCSCCECHDPRILNFGNVLEEPIIELWNSSKYNKFRQDFNEGKTQICCDCILKKGVFKTYG